MSCFCCISSLFAREPLFEPLFKPLASEAVPPWGEMPMEPILIALVTELKLSDSLQEGFLRELRIVLPSFNP